ncbi:MAG TPA: hypothetical protein VFQ40_09280 [Actinomycetota bacterium]|nr:hypothetical protein [Actinomycetota bacterium]
MRVTFVDGPLGGREEEIPDDRLERGQPVYWPSKDALEDEDPDVPGPEGAVEYLYEGDGRARYVGGRITGG